MSVAASAKPQEGDVSMMACLTVAGISALAIMLLSLGLQVQVSSAARAPKWLSILLIN